VVARDANGGTTSFTMQNECFAYCSGIGPSNDGDGTITKGACSDDVGGTQSSPVPKFNFTARASG
jgi:hypothetical protein